MRYRATVTREASVWVGEIPSLDGASASASSLDELATKLRDVVVGDDDLVDDAAVKLELVTPPPQPDKTPRPDTSPLG